MTLWLDAQLPPALAAWIFQTFGISTTPVRDLGLTTAKDAAIFEKARDANAVLGSPPQILWITCGNTSNARLKEVLAKCLPDAISQLTAGSNLVEIADKN